MQAKSWKQDLEVNIWTKRDENEWRRLHNELDSSYHSPNTVRMIKCRRLRWAGLVAKMEEGRRAFKIVTGEHIGKRPLGRPRRSQNGGR